MSKIKFEEEEHKYFNTETGEEYTSCTTFIGKFKVKFDSDTMSKRIALRDGLTQEEVLKKWKDKTDKACERGTKFHLAMENNIRFGEVDPEYKKVIEDFNIKMEKFYPKMVGIHSEILLYNDEYKIAGMSDVCIDMPNNTFIIADFKTNEKFTFSSPFNNWLLPPVEHLSECHFNSYALQMSLYAYMHEILTGKRCIELLLLWLNSKTGKWEFYRANYLKAEIEAMLKSSK